MRRIVGAYEEVAACRGQLLGVLHEEGAKLFIVATFPRIQHQRHWRAGHGDFGMHMRTQPLHSLQARSSEAQGRAFETVRQYADVFHSTVTDFARLRGWSTSVPFSTAT